VLILTNIFGHVICVIFTSLVELDKVPYFAIPVGGLEAIKVVSCGQ